MSAFDFILKPLENAFEPLIEAVTGAFGGGRAGKQPPPARGNGGGTPEDLANALGHYTETEPFKGADNEHDREVQKFAKDYPEAGPAEVAAYSVGQHYENTGKPPPDTAPLGNLDTPEGRVKALAKVTQQQQGDSGGEEKCGAASIVGAALLAGGTEPGLTTLMDAMEKRTDAAGQKALDVQFKKIRDEIHDHKPITIKDMHTLQSTLYAELKTDIAGEELGVGDPGVKMDTLQNFVHGDDKLASMFADNHMDIEAINNHPLKDDEDKNGPRPDKHYELNRDNNHAVLQIKDGKGNVIGVYDPYKRDEGQVVTKKDELEDYTQAHESK